MTDVSFFAINDWFFFLWQLSDFGLAIWGPPASAFLTKVDVVGTFGYLAPEYFMYGKVSDKVDVYAFGVVLLELLSGRKPINSDAPKGQESLVMWVSSLPYAYFPHCINLLNEHPKFATLGKAYHREWGCKKHIGPRSWWKCRRGSSAKNGSCS